MLLGLLACCHLGTLLAPAHLGAHQEEFAEVHSSWLAQRVIPGVIPPRGQDFVLLSGTTGDPDGSAAQPSALLLAWCYLQNCPFNQVINAGGEVTGF